jgi:uncharacterized protein YijF (DUF1287 family)
LQIATDPSAYRPGDIVTWQLLRGVPHIGIVSNPVTEAERFEMIHNVGADTRREDCLFAFKITGHYRYPNPDSNP